MPHGLLLINLGTPDRANIAAVKKYLREFLTDKRVIDLPAPVRYLLVYAFILPFRAAKSSRAYQQIWTNEGSPLLRNSLCLVDQLQNYLGQEYKVALGMRYGSPSIEQALNQLKDSSSLTVLPLYPQYSSAATGSSIEEVMDVLKSKEVLPSLKIIRDFYQNPAYLEAQAALVKPFIGDHEHLIFSYHGLPERQIIKSGCVTVCQELCPPVSLANQACYKAQCHETSSLLASKLNLSREQYSTAFQSRLGKTPWIKPYTDDLLSDLAAKGIKNIAIACPSFVTDCLETIEEIGIRARQQWQTLGGKKFTLISCLNTDTLWLKAIKEII